MLMEELLRLTANRDIGGRSPLKDRIRQPQFGKREAGLKKSSPSCKPQGRNSFGGHQRSSEVSGPFFLVTDGLKPVGVSRLTNSGLLPISTYRFHPLYWFDKHSANGDTEVRILVYRSPLVSLGHRFACMHLGLPLENLPRPPEMPNSGSFFT